MLSPLPKLRRECALEVLGLLKRANAGHIGASLSCLEILIDLACHRMSKEDQLLLSKGHAASALYVTLAKAGRLPSDLLKSFYQDGTLLAAHPPCSNRIPSIPFGTGSLGHGLSLATGMALSQRYTGRSFQVHCVLSDGECNEGSTWEAALFAGHHHLKNLNVIVDANGIQGVGYTKDVLDLSPLERKWEEFGFATARVKNGNDFSSLAQGYKELSERGGDKPRCIIAHTTKGHGVSFMENTVDWHYLPMSQSQYLQAIQETEMLDA